MAKTSKFNGSKVQLQKLTPSASVNITAVGVANPATITAQGLNAKRGDVLIITGLDGFSGSYVVASVSSNVFTLAGVDWQGRTAPANYNGAKVALAQFFDNFCELKSFQKSASSVEQVDVSTICSTNGKEYEAGEYEEGTLTLQYYQGENSPVQQALEAYERSMDKFWVRLVLLDGTAILFYGSVESGPSLDGQVGGRWECSVGVKLSGRRVVLRGGA